MSGSFKLLSITVTAALLSACGGQSDDANVGPAEVECLARLGCAGGYRQDQGCGR